MEFDEEQENGVPGRIPVFGAIFMSNSTTKKECFRRNLFGLPPSQAGFVKKVKSGMILFLFEYEKRKLYGVFQACSDGAIDIVPNAFSSSGKAFSAQVSFTTIWNCHPLSEHDFCGAIKDNYYTPNKFHFGLSKDQVCSFHYLGNSSTSLHHNIRLPVQRLLWLFNSRRVKIQHSQNLLAGSEVVKQSRKSLDKVQVTEKGKFVTTHSVENELNVDNRIRPVILTKYRGLPRSNLNPSVYPNKPILETDDSIVEYHHRLSPTVAHSVEQRISNLRCSKSHEDAIVMSNQPFCTVRGHPYHPEAPSCQDRYSSSFGINRNPPSVHELDDHSRSSVDSFFSSPSSQLVPFHVEPENLSMSISGRRSLDVPTDLGDFIPLSSSDHYESSRTSIPFSGAEYFGNKTREPTSFEGYKGLSFSEPNEHTVPFSRGGHFKRENVEPISFIPGKGPSHVSDYGYPVASRHEYANERAWFGNYESSTSTVPLSNEGQCHLDGVYPLESTCIDCTEHSDPTYHDDEDYLSTMGLYSSIPDTRTSVFSRLTLAPEAIIQENDDFVGHGYNVNASVDEVMEMLHQRHSCWSETISKSKPFITQPDDDEKFKHRTQMETPGDPALANEDETWSNDQMVEEIPLVNFKRRSEIRKIRSDSKAGGYVEGAESEGSSGKQRKRRKLVRPTFSNKEGKENTVTREAPVISNRSEGNENRLSQKVGVQCVICPTNSEGEKNKMEKISSNEDSKVGVVQEIVGTIGVWPNVQESYKKNYEGKGNAEIGEASLKSDEAEDDGKGLSQNVGIQNAVCPVICEGEIGNVQESYKKICQGEGKSESCEAPLRSDGGENHGKGFSQNVGIQSAVCPVIIEGKNGKAGEDSSNVDSKVERLSQEIFGVIDDSCSNVQDSSQEICEC
ncbi:hypothetical protein HHK36_000675 [Tetracentron sinense]|uniref:DCD domain-containing protein n=1 Tax=Tetracentron sinense TaxID=13715 RepID=A0A834ZUJ1_TETSI|nr:hypothetical protein HHK36_000675 [Tetracentron sinense]